MTLYETREGFYFFYICTLFSCLFTYIAFQKKDFPSSSSSDIPFFAQLVNSVLSTFTF